MSSQPWNKLTNSDGATESHGVEDLRTVLCQIREEIRDIRARLTEKLKEYYTVEEVAQLTGRTPYTVRRWIKGQRIQATRIAGTGPKGRLLISRSSVEID